MERISVFEKKRIYNGLDLLKFVMALAVVAIHVKPFSTAPLLYRIACPILRAAVPTFFLITSFLFFCKYYSRESRDRGRILGGYCKRIGLLYIVWFVIDIGFIILRKNYFQSGGENKMGTLVIQLVKDVFFASTYPGSWFLSASVMALVFVCLMSRYLGSLVTFFLCLLISLYIAFHSVLPELLQIPYNWYAATFREEVNLSFPFAMVWMSMGEIMAKSSHYQKWEMFGKSHKKLLAALFVLVFLVALCGFEYTSYFIVPLIFVLACCVDLKDSKIYRYLRNSSILVFFSHFWIAGKKCIFLDLIGYDITIFHIVYYLIVVAVCFSFAMIVLLLEQKRGLKFLKYLH